MYYERGKVRLQCEKGSREKCSVLIRWGGGGGGIASRWQADKKEEWKGLGSRGQGKGRRSRQQEEKEGLSYQRKGRNQRTYQDGISTTKKDHGMIQLVKCDREKKRKGGGARHQGKTERGGRRDKRIQRELGGRIEKIRGDSARAKS